MSYWDTKSEKTYSGMRKRHPDVWHYLDRFIAARKIKSILEVGCGLVSPVCNMVDEYQAVDVNISTDAIHEDFTTMDVTQFEGKYDLLFSSAVIEHCNGYEKFIEQVVKVKPKYAIITFFNGLHWEENLFMECIKEEETLGKFWWNRYCEKSLKDFLSKLGLNYDLTNYKAFHKRDVILFIDFTC